jgi:hypothetical protein
MPSKFRIVASRRLGLENCEFDVTVAEGEVLRGETFEITERGTLWQYIVTGIRPAPPDTVTLECVTWLVTDGAFVGEWCESREMKKSERKMYAKAWPPDLQ